MLPIAGDVGYVWNCPVHSSGYSHICVQINKQENITCFHWPWGAQFLFQKPVFRQWQHFVWCCNPFELSRLTHLKKKKQQKTEAEVSGANSFLSCISFKPNDSVDNPKGLHDMWVRTKVGPERQVHSWYRWVQFLEGQWNWAWLSQRRLNFTQLGREFIEVKWSHPRMNLASGL